MMAAHIAAPEVRPLKIRGPVQSILIQTSHSKNAQDQIDGSKGRKDLLIPAISDDNVRDR